MQNNEGQPSPAELKAHLEKDVLHLPDAGISMNIGGYFEDALRSQAIPFVDLLVNLQESQVTRTNDTLAEFQSKRQGKEYRMYTEHWTVMLKRAIYALAQTAGITVSINDNLDITGNDISRVAKLLETITLPPALQQRIEKISQEQSSGIEAELPTLEAIPQRTKIQALLALIGVKTKEKSLTKTHEDVIETPSVDFYLKIQTVAIPKETEVRPSVWEYTEQVTSISLTSNSADQKS